jgi:hypothetical protein
MSSLSFFTYGKIVEQKVIYWFFQRNPEFDNACKSMVITLVAPAASSKDLLQV